MWDLDSYKKNWSSIHESCFRGHRNGTVEVVDFEANIVFFPLPNSILSIPFWQLRGYAREFEKQKIVKQFGYWNNTDLPDGVSEFCWQKRRAEWELATINKTGIPALDGFQITIVNYMPPLPHEVWKKLHREEKIK